MTEATAVDWGVEDLLDARGRKVLRRLRVIDKDFRLGVEEGPPGPRYVWRSGEDSGSLLVRDCGRDGRTLADDLRSMLELARLSLSLPKWTA